jgi:1-acyl-sn-glycerol-3-phosphate acyltransferase
VNVLRFPAHVVEGAVFDLEVTGKEHIPPKGPVVVAANHFSHLDVPILGSNIGRYPRFLAVDELYGRSRAFDAMMAFFGAIPLDRDGYPVRALRSAVDYLHDGNVIGVFPEGRRVEEWGGDPPKPGAAWLAWMSGAPLVPVAIHGTEQSLSPGTRGFRRTAVRMWIEEPLWWHDYAERVEPLRSMMHDWYERVDERLEPWRNRGKA